MYAVFGMTKTVAMEKAKKITDAVEIKGGEKVMLSIDEYRANLDRKAAELFNSMRPMQLSPLYGSRKQAEQYLKMAQEAGGGNLAIKRKDAERDASGTVVMNSQTKKPAKMVWVSA